MKKIFIVSIFSIMVVSCNSGTATCTLDFKDLDLYPVRVKIKIPEYQITDTTIYGPGRTLLNYKIQTLDTLLNVIVFIDDYTDYVDEQSNLDRIKSLQKGEIESGQNQRNLLRKQFEILTV
jgi:hypothetical protein